MRIVVLAPSLYSETASAMAVQLAEMGYIPSGALALRSLDREILARKLGQWGVREVARYARAKLMPHRGDRRGHTLNPYLQSALNHEGGVFRSLHEVGARYGFPVAICKNQNGPDSMARLKEWAPDLIIFTGGNILRRELLDVPRLGVLNVHLGMLPEIRGMSSPEWSLLKNVPVGITIHYMDAGIDTGPILQRHEFPDAARCESLSELRNRLIAFGVEKMAEVVAALNHAMVSAAPQPHLDEDRQFFVMHEWLQARAADRLKKTRPAAVVGAANG